MRTGLLLHASIVLAVGVGLVSCTKEEINQAMNRPAEIIQSSSSCTPAGVSSTSTPELCVNLMEIQLSSHDSQADVSMTLVNRTGRRLFLYMPSLPSLTDSSGTRWGTMASITGVSRYASESLPVDPNAEAQISVTFRQSGQAPADLTFSLRGEIAILKVDSRGAPIPGKNELKRGFNLSGIRPMPQQPRSSGPANQSLDTKLTQVSPLGVDPATSTSNGSALSQSSTPVAVVGASGGSATAPRTVKPDVLGNTSWDVS